MAKSTAALRAVGSKVSTRPVVCGSYVTKTRHALANDGGIALRLLGTITPVKGLPDVWFTGTSPRNYPASVNRNGSNEPPDERKLKLGKTLRVLQELSGRVAYSAALWTSPLAWGRVPGVGNVKLDVLSERMIKSPSGAYYSPTSSRSQREQLVVRWRTIGKTRGKGTGPFYKGIGAKDNVDKITEWLGGGKGEDDKKEFTGLFIFEFDEEGRILNHTIEHVQEDGNWENGVGARVVGLTDWLLGGLRNGRSGEGTPCPAFWGSEERNPRRK